jgi:hypothetical protein
MGAVTRVYAVALTKRYTIENNGNSHNCLKKHLFYLEPICQSHQEKYSACD